MTLKECDARTAVCAGTDNKRKAKDDLEMEDGDSFTFDTDNVDPVEKFHIPSMVEERALQKIAVKVARAHPDIVTVGDYRRIPFKRLRAILIDLKLPPRDVTKFANAVSRYVGFDQ